MSILVHACIVYLHIFISFLVYIYIYTNRERERERQRDRETKRQRDRETERERERERGRERFYIHRYIYLYTQPCTSYVYVQLNINIYIYMHVYIRSLWMYVMWCGSRSYTSDPWNFRHFPRTHNGTQRQDMDCQVLWRRQSPPLVDRTTRDSDCYRRRQQPHGHPVWWWTFGKQTQNSLHQGRVQEDMEVSDSICILVLLY